MIIMTTGDQMKTQTRHEQLRQSAQEFHNAHPFVYEMFDKYTREVISWGFKNYAGQTIFERIRWKTDQAKTGEKEFKMNNNHMPFYTRRWMKMNPEYDGFFRTREQISKKQSPVNLPELTPQYFDNE